MIRETTEPCVFLSHGLGTVGRVLTAGTEMLARAGVESARLDAELLLATVLSKRREDLYIGSETAITEEQRNIYQSMLSRRMQREPVAYIVGNREFWSLSFAVAPEVLIPRPETELLVELALISLGDQRVIGERPIRVLDLGTGSGAIAVSLARERDDLEVWGIDLSPDAVAIAHLNARRYGLENRCHFICGDLFAPVLRKSFFHLIISNPPYIRRAEIERLPLDVRGWEPRMALDGGIDGLDFYQVIVGQASTHLKDGGSLLLEIGSDLGPQVGKLFAASARYRDCTIHADYAQRPRVVSARVVRGAGGPVNGNYSG